jgi:hypothetical protein
MGGLLGCRPAPAIATEAAPQVYGEEVVAATPLLRRRRSCGEEIRRLSFGRKLHLHALWLPQLCGKPNTLFGFRGRQ